MIHTRFGVQVVITGRNGGYVLVEDGKGWTAWRKLAELKADNGLAEIEIARDRAPKMPMPTRDSKVKQAGLDALNS